MAAPNRATLMAGEVPGIGVAELAGTIDEKHRNSCGVRYRNCYELRPECSRATATQEYAEGVNGEGTTAEGVVTSASRREPLAIL